jgi:hypothetical protein
MCDDTVGCSFLDQVGGGKARIRKRRDLGFKLIGEVGGQSKVNEVVFACQGHGNQVSGVRKFGSRGTGVEESGIMSEEERIIPGP